MTLENDRTKKDIRNSTWHLLAEISLTSDSDQDGDEAILAAKLLAEAIRESGLPPINVHKVERIVDSPSLPTESSHTLIEIFFYREVKAS